MDSRSVHQSLARTANHECESARLAMYSAERVGEQASAKKCVLLLDLSKTQTVELSKTWELIRTLKAERDGTNDSLGTARKLIKIQLQRQDTTLDRAIARVKMQELETPLRLKKIGELRQMHKDAVDETHAGLDEAHKLIETLTATLAKTAESWKMQKAELTKTIAAMESAMMATLAAAAQTAIRR
jgi:hypothetical protein